MKYRTENGVVIDDRNNRATIARWGSEVEAIKSLESLDDGCSDCSDCSSCCGCFGCFGCSRCSDCSDCFDCSDCSGCSGCSRCSLCSSCSDCSDCSDCFDCSDCSDCSGCSGVNGAAEVSGFAVPRIDDIHKKLYAAVSQPNALKMDSWHTCDTTHCRAGWVVHLAGPAGYALERQTTTLFAAQQIYRASGHNISPVRFFDSNEKAMADMQALAGE